MDLPAFLAHGALKDGRDVVIRAIRADDRQRLVEAFGRLAPETVYKRFFGFKKELGKAELDDLTHVDYDRVVLLVVTIATDAGEHIIGAARYVRSGETTPSAAEISFTVADAYQGQGIASRLLGTLAGIARERGIVRFDAEVLADNAPMVAVFARSGLPMRESRDSGVIRITLDLGAGTSGHDAGARRPHA